eukprot:TRINITY_DN3992_c0_g1_i1.p1 TRINITY_DN3992_c0_g1~~TRINITY_DN3992_c0_g1_i1.p1  ORF type:complete len:241 (-),score=51.60 TRINITY_DN3992_c0_g1_i1:416-1138(-)
MAMEVTVCHVENVPEGYLLSLRAGGSRRQAPLLKGQTFHFGSQSTSAAASLDSGTGLKIDILSLEGSTRIAAEDLPQDGGGLVQVNVPVNEQQPAAPGSDGGPMRVVLDIRCTQDGRLCTTRVVLKGPGETAVDLPPPVAATEPKPAFEPASAAPAAGGAAAAASLQGGQQRTPVQRRNEACSYLADHSIMPFVESMMRTLMTEQPADPWARVASLLPADVQPQLLEAVAAQQQASAGGP